MPENEYVMQKIASDRDNLSNGIYFSDCDDPGTKKHSVLVVRPDSGTYEYDLPCDQESTSDTLDDFASEFTKIYVNKIKKILFVGSIVSLIILCCILLGIKHVRSGNSQSKPKLFEKVDMIIFNQLTKAISLIRYQIYFQNVIQFTSIQSIKI